MRQFAAGAVLGLGLTFAHALAAAEDAPAELACQFKDGASWSYVAGAFQSKTPSPLAFEIENIDLEGQTAVLKTGAGAGTVRIVRAINANHFLEVVNEGFLNLTTVYDKDPATGVHPAVHSRHFGLIGQPVFAQYTGTCREKRSE
ncbi:MAG TPA: hypothetical protein VJ045_11655 [Hyphomicrobiaceae bacterium]|nr:hypothetical protein [Hyphomicrobiaceae bacterium]